VTELIGRSFPGASVNIEPGDGTGRLAGWITWDGFRGLDHVERQQRLREAIADLPMDDQLLLGPILTMTPDEASDDEEAA